MSVVAMEVIHQNNKIRPDGPSMSDIVKCTQCGKHFNKYVLVKGVCKACIKSNHSYWDQFTTEEGDSS